MMSIIVGGIPEHIDLGVQKAWRALNDAICGFERATFRTYALFLIPHAGDEEVQVSVNGKDVWRKDLSHTGDPEQLFNVAIGRRKDNSRPSTEKELLEG